LNCTKLPGSAEYGNENTIFGGNDDTDEWKEMVAPTDITGLPNVPVEPGTSGTAWFFIVAGSIAWSAADSAITGTNPG